ncbi:MAG: response regulator [Gammaproteobacteria bacterium]|nr:response regulator [Gammaproteobacteria bacterium]
MESPLAPKESAARRAAPATATADFLAGGGEVGARLRALNWSDTPLGPPGHWPQSLKTIVRVMLDSRYAMWMLWGPDLTFFCNDAYLPTVGIKRDWVLGARADKVWEEIWPDIGPRIGRVLEHGEATWDEALLLFLERSGFPEETYHTFSYSPVYDDASRIAGMLCVVTEVTERVIGERHLRILRDLAARGAGMESVQQACGRLVGVLGENLLDVPFSCLYLIDEAAPHGRLASHQGNIPERLCPRTVETGAADPWRLGEAIRERSYVVSLAELGETVPSLWPEQPIGQAVVLPIQGRGSAEPVAVLVAGVSPRRALDDSYRGFLELVAGQFGAAIADAQAYEAERQRAEALTAIDRAKTLFFSNVSHEFRTPLTLMLGPIAEAASSPETPPAMRTQLELAHRNSLRLLKLVNSLLDFSRIEAGRAQASYEPAPLAALTRDLASTFRSTIERAGLRFTVSCEDLPEPVHVDREMWEKIVLNLLSNAFKFTLAGEITVRLYESGGKALLEVADTGVGIPEHELPRLFERFHRVEGAGGRTQEGSGIGLALAQELVGLHGGTIEAASELGRGSVFRIRIPFGTAHLPADRIRAPRTIASTATGTQAYLQEALRWLPEPASSVMPAAAGTDEAALLSDALAHGAESARILLADDNADMRAYVRELLAPLYAVELAADGEQALAAARRSRPDLILSDVMMPRLDGFGLLRALRDEESLRDIPFILLTARAGEESRIEGLEAGADDYLVKPFNARELLARVSGTLALARIRRELRASEIRFRTVLDASPAGLVLLAAERDADNAVVDFRWVYLNRSAQDMLGERAQQLIGGRFGAAPREAAQQQELFDSYLAAVESGAMQTIETSWPAAASSGKTHFNLVARFGDGVLVWFIDITAHKHNEQVLQRQELALREADRRKDEFLAMLAHELRNPLAPIRYANELLGKILDPSDARVENAIAATRRQVAQLSRLVDDLLDVSRVTQGRIELQRQPLQVSHLILQAIEAAQPILREKHHRLVTVHCVEPADLHVNADPARLVQCLVNVLTNAAKYTDPGGQITVQTRAEGQSALIEISDTGMGIAPELLPRVFDLFVQGDRGPDRSQGGLGVGLAVVKRLIEMHDGTVSARSDGLQQGSTFEIRLPLIEQANSPGEEPALAAKSPAARILIVDDNRDAADSLAALLALEDHTIERVYSAAAALQRAAEFRPEVILLDIGLPEMDGYEVARRLRMLPGLRESRLIAVTGYGQPQDRERARAAGFDEHLIKPVSSASVARAIAGMPPRGRQAG